MQATPIARVVTVKGVWLTWRKLTPLRTKQDKRRCCSRFDVRRSPREIPSRTQQRHDAQPPPLRCNVQAHAAKGMYAQN